MYLFIFSDLLIFLMYVFIEIYKNIYTYIDVQNACLYIYIFVLYRDA